jgi:DNA-binding LacI/PurR family transcriptional regulator
MTDTTGSPQRAASDWLAASALWQLAGRRPTIEDVARVAGVSRSTVSRVLNGGLHVRSEAVSRVNTAIGVLGYSVNQAARDLATGRAGSVTLVISGPGEFAGIARVGGSAPTYVGDGSAATKHWPGAAPPGRPGLIVYGVSAGPATRIEDHIAMTATTGSPQRAASGRLAVSESRPLGARRPTIEDVARMAGVSRSTVSRVLNGGLHVRPEAISRVTNAVGALGYSVNQAARNLASGRTGSVAFVISEQGEHLFGDPNFGVLVRTFSRELRSRGQHLLVTTAQDYGEESFLGDYLTAGHVDGVLFSLPRDGEALLDRVASSGPPLVVMGEPLGYEEELSWVAIDDAAAAFEGVSYLLGQGRSVIGTITGPVDTSSGRGRLEGYRRAVGRDSPQSLVAFGDWSPASGRAGAQQLLERHPEMDGLFVASDLMALDAMAVLKASGRRVPRDVAVVGFDDSTAAVRADPPLTTVHLPFEQSATEAVRILSELIAESRPPQHVILQTRMIQRDSA